MKYNYVIFGCEIEFYEMQIRDIASWDSVKWIPKLLYDATKIMRFFYRAHMSGRLNSIIRIPLKSIWNPLYFKNHFKDNKPICFIFLTSTSQNYNLLEYGYMDFLRKQYPNCKTVLYFMDLVKWKAADFNNFSVERIKAIYDLIITYNKYDAEEYGFTYHPGYISKLGIRRSEDYPRSDLVFIGKAKDRLPLLLSIYEKARDYGLKCDFYIVDAPTDQQKYPEEIHYGKFISYTEMLQRSIDSRCILEISQAGALGYTSRFVEAVMYDKLLLTNNPIYFESPLTNRKWMQFFSEAADIDFDFIKKAKEDIHYNYAGELSPVKLLEWLDDYPF